MRVIFPWKAADHYGAPNPSYITQDCTSVEWNHDGTEKQGWYCGDKQDQGNPVFFDIDGYHYKGKRLSYASSCIHFDCEAGVPFMRCEKGTIAEAVGRVWLPATVDAERNLCVYTGTLGLPETET